MKPQKTPYYSYKIGNLARGCELCVKGEKSVLFCTGLCTMRCFYCPISDQKKNKDAVYINEVPNADYTAVIEEIELCSSKGVGITGGDPLVKLDRTIELIRLLKKRFGKKFHIHLYTPLALVDSKKLGELYSAGLDEIRFHPDLNKRQEWAILELAKRFKWKMGVEIPAIPGKKQETIVLINYLDSIKIDFLNINELEISDTNAQKLLEQGFKPKNSTSYGVKGSEELALDLLKYILQNKIKLNVHYCTTTLKDRVQLANRIKNRAKNAKEKFDVLTKDGMLIRGAVYLGEIYPTFSYKARINGLTGTEKNNILKKLNIIKNKIKKEFKLKNDEIKTDERNLRIILNKNLVNKVKDKFDKHFKNLKFAVIEEYPTYDSLIVEAEFK